MYHERTLRMTPEDNNNEIIKSKKYYNMYSVALVFSEMIHIRVPISNTRVQRPLCTAQW